MQILNNRPSFLSEDYEDNPTGALDVGTIIQKNFLDHLLNPIDPSKPVTITENNQSIDPNEIATKAIESLDGTIEPQRENLLKNYLERTLIHYDKSLPFQFAHSVECGIKEKMPLPSPSVIYTAKTDIIPVVKGFIGGVDSREKMFASFAFFSNIQTFGVYMLNNDVYEAFKEYVAGEYQNYQSVMSAETIQMFMDFLKTDLNQLTECFLLRANIEDNNEPFSFARFIVHFAKEFAKTKPESEIGLFPFSVSSMIVPTSITFINLEQHMNATHRAISKEWNALKQGTTPSLNIVSIKKLRKAKTVYRQQQKLQNMANSIANQNGVVKHKRQIIAKRPPTNKETAKRIQKIAAKMTTVRRSQNAFKEKKMTYLKASRRNPDDPNLKGTLVSTKYKPDLHVYVDTSGSISPDQYADSVKTIISIAKKMNVNLYFNSFSDYLSQAALIQTKDKTTKQIYSTIEKIPKVTGGTNFNLVWKYINASKKRQSELSIMITDFGYYPHISDDPSPKNLYYIPCSNMDFEGIKQWANEFAKSAKMKNPHIYNRMLL